MPLSGEAGCEPPRFKTSKRIQNDSTSGDIQSSWRLKDSKLARNGLDRGSMRISKIVAVVLAFLVFGAGISGCGQATDSTSANVVPAAEVFTPQHPTALQAFQGLYHTPDTSGRHTVDAKHLASLWLSKELADGDKKLFVVLVQEQQLDETGALEVCHACTAALHAMTFTKTEKGWSIANVQQNIANIGAWGKAPEIAKADVFALTPGNVLLLIPEEYGAMGESERGLQLLDHFQSKWADAGYVSISGDNLGGECSNDSDPSEPKHCYSFTGTLSKENGKSLTYPDLVVTKKGTEYDAATGAVVSAKSERYLFKGAGYLSAKQEREKDTDAKNAQLTQGKQLASTPPYAPALSPAKEAAPVVATEPATPKVSKPAKDIDQEFTRCLMPAVQYGQYSSYDGGKSAVKLLLEKCHHENLNWVAHCKSHGESDDSCQMKALIAAQAILKMFGK